MGTPSDQTVRAVSEAFPIDQVLESLTAIVLGVDADGYVSVWNSAAQHWLGLGPGEVLGRSLVELPLPWSDVSVTHAILAAGHGDRAVRIDDVRYQGPEGAEGFLGLTANPMGSSIGRGRSVLVFGRDITEHRARESQQMHSLKLEAIGQLAAGIAHEINTPTQYVTDNLLFLRDSFQELMQIVARGLDRSYRAPDGSLPEPAVRALDEMAEQLDVTYLMDEIPRAAGQAIEGAGRVAKIVRAMRGFSHPGSEEKTDADLNRGIEDTVTVSSNEWKYVAEVELILEPGLPSIRGYPGELNQVFLNMIVNAAHAIAAARSDESAPKGKITIRTQSTPDAVLIRIEDTGAGIPEPIRHRVFDPFFTTKPVGKGTGQGLSLARSIIVDKHGGSIQLESELGVGTAFLVRVPRHGRSE